MHFTSESRVGFATTKGIRFDIGLQHDLDCGPTSLRSEYMLTIDWVVCKPCPLTLVLFEELMSIRQHYSDAVKRINTVTGQNMQEAFFQEAQQSFHLENNRASLPTAQGLLVLFMASAFLSRDGAAPIYRTLAYNMIDRLRLEDKVPITEDEKEKTAYCTAAWGFYCCEM